MATRNSSARIASLLQSVPVARTGRVSRRPQHPFQVRHRPYQIQPMFIAPVLPGETMKNLLMQSRVVTDPIKNPLIGWWLEYYFFYIKHRDLDEREEFTQMMLNQDWDDANVDATVAVASHYFYGSGIDWVDHCLKRITAEYFRDEGEAWDVATRDGLPLASVTGRTWFDSIVSAANMPDEYDVDVDSNADDTITAGEVDAAMRQWNFMRANGLTEMSYEDFLATYGIRTPRVEHHRPELVRFVRTWSYPSNTIDPTNGTPSSAVSWSIAERADKDRFFTEPGFLFGVTVARPKVYFSGQKGSVTSLLNNAYSWLPAVMRDDPFTSMRLVADGATAGPLGDVTDAGGYWVDLRDLYTYGEQFVNFAVTETDAGMVALPTAGLAKKYPSDASVDALFSSDTKELVRQDGIVSLNILGTQRDQTASTS